MECFTVTLSCLRYSGMLGHREIFFFFFSSFKSFQVLPQEFFQSSYFSFLFICFGVLHLDSYGYHGGSINIVSDISGIFPTAFVFSPLYFSYLYHSTFHLSSPFCCLIYSTVHSAHRVFLFL